MKKNQQNTGISGVMAMMPPRLEAAVSRLPEAEQKLIEEIRLRLARPTFIGAGGERKILRDQSGQALVITKEELDTALHRITQGSVYALTEELQRGYITVQGGHRVGIAGRVVLNGSGVETIRDISSLNFRIAKEVRGCGERVLPHLLNRGHLLNTLVFSPPCGGKTTLLRDLTRLIGDGATGKNRNVAVIDQRSEIAGSFLGQPQLDVGKTTDILDGVSKAQGMNMAIRALGPQVLVTDEIGDAAEKNAILEACNSGISLLLSAHGKDWQELSNRPLVKDLLGAGVFQRLVQLANNGSPGEVVCIYTGAGEGL